MALMSQLYSAEEIKKLSEEDLQKLRHEILKVLNNDTQVRGLLKQKTQSMYNDLVGKKP